MTLTHDEMQVIEDEARRFGPTAISFPKLLAAYREVVGENERLKLDMTGRSE